VGIISPANLGVVPSIEMVVWVAVGGRGTLSGAVLGAILVGWARSSFSESFPDIWQYFLGALFIGSVILFPAGIVGFLKAWLSRIQKGISLRRVPAPKLEPAGELDRGVS
jgi:urea transport system permease protein